MNKLAKQGTNQDWGIFNTTPGNLRSGGLFTFGIVVGTVDGKRTYNIAAEKLGGKENGSHETWVYCSLVRKQ